ncbi:related to emopamil-binding protein [Rhynchosporium agropyri]|uniref:Related to emopamil-binding protein n=2 Tax=Rhynchosporium TaxID=38037 RepID=A0A1E1LH04_9HELO|nr:related to emopamil-binding protein [Rhynchosporium commune]CZT09808.1 related to emopamil-binding protein [Rhynchosporium agropyri]
MASAVASAMNASSPLTGFHPFYPLEVEIAAYLANESSTGWILSLFVAGILTIIGTTRFLVQKFRPNLHGKDKAAIWWYVISGLIHLCFEGYFSLNHTRMAPAQDLFGQLWKEYALSDSRYLVSDPFVLCMESWTAWVWGPMCLFVAYFIISGNPLRHPLAIIVGVGQMYGLVLYYATALFDHYYNSAAYSRPEFLYFWVYFFAVNFIWMIVPGLLLFDSVRTIARTFAAYEKLTSASKKGTNGNAKGSKKEL